MRNGDISNISGYSIAIRAEECLIHFKQDTGIKGFINKVLFGRYHNAILNEKAVKLLAHLSRNTDNTVVLIINKYSALEKELLLNFLKENSLDVFSDIRTVYLDSHLTTLLRSNIISYYVDTDKSRISKINSPYALSLEEAFDLFGKESKNVRRLPK